MGANSEAYIEMREAEVNRSFAQELHQEEAYSQQATMMQGLHAALEVFQNDCEKYEQGEISPIELAVKFKQEQDLFEALYKARKDWLNENVSSITNEAEQYGKEGFRGFFFTKQVRETPSFKHIPEWVRLDQAKKDFETKSKLALKMVQKGGLNVDEDGAEIPLPEITTTSFIKVDKAK